MGRPGENFLYLIQLAITSNLMPMFSKDTSTHQRTPPNVSVAENMTAKGISRPGIISFKRLKEEEDAADHQGGVTQLMIEGTLPVKIYRRKGGSNAALINGKLDTYNNVSKSGALPDEELIEELTKLEKDVTAYLKHPEKGAAAEGIMKEIAKEKKVLYRKVMKVKGAEEMNRYLEEEKDIKPAASSFTKEPGAKAGFELEWNNVMWLDSSQQMDKQFMELLLTDTPSAVKQYTPQIRLAQSFPKRTALFVSPENSWEGQADSTIPQGANLEIVTRPLSPAQWHVDAVQKDSDLMNDFSKALDTIPPFTLFRPEKLVDGIIPLHPSAYLFKRDNTNGPQVQMTKALPLEKASEIPDWWLPGLNINAFLLIKSTVAALNSVNYQGGNPKSAFGGVILKTPILNVLGSPDPAVTEEMKELWVVGIAKKCLITNNLDSMVAEQLVNYSRNKDLYSRPEDFKKENKLAETRFTWREYLKGLLKGIDLITQWAKTAFEHSNEDIGYGQIDDETLSRDWAIKEYRNDRKLDITNYVDMGQSWAKEIGHEYASSIRKEDTGKKEEIQ